MKKSLSERSLWAVELASRLRLLQISCADQSSSERQKFIAEEIERALKDVLPEKRKSYLEALGERFPSWESAQTIDRNAQQTESISDDPVALLSKLLDLLPSLSAEHREKFQEKLKAAGLVPETQNNGSAGLSKELSIKLSISADQAIDVDRAAKLLIALVNWMVALDQPIWKIWKQIAPNSNVRREGGTIDDFRLQAGKYLSGNPDISIDQFTTTLEQSRKLIAGIMLAIAPAIKRYAARDFYQFSPETIEELARMDKGWGGIEQKCWKKYVELARSQPTEASIEKEIRDQIAKCAEEVIVGPTSVSNI